MTGWQMGERTHLLGGGGGTAPNRQDSLEKPESSGDGTRSAAWRRGTDMAIGFALCALLAMVWHNVIHHPHHNQHRAAEPAVHVSSRSQQQGDIPLPPHHHKGLSYDDDDDYVDDDKGYSSDYDDDTQASIDNILSSNEHLTSKYTHFQAMGFQIYTGGAPALLVDPHRSDDKHSKPKLIHNPECDGLNSYGHFDDYDITNDTLPSSLWQCYLGHEDPVEDTRHRMDFMMAAVDRAHQEATKDPNTLKIFVAPEFFWRGREGAYVYDAHRHNSTRRRRNLKHHNHHYSPMLADEEDDDSCTEVCLIMKGLESLVSQKKYKDWLFLFGTIVVSENLPKEDPYDKLFYNFAPVYKGYDPDTEDHYGKRFLVPKRYVSNVDFLTPVRQYDGNLTKELVELTQPQREMAKKKLRSYQQQGTPTEEGEDHAAIQVAINNPFVMMRDFYDRDIWYEYKDELKDLGYEMLEYDWLILDNITFTIEVCLDHDARTALNAYLADNVLGSPTRIPKSVADWDPIAEKYVGRVEHVKIPRHQAQLSLVSSMGMTANPQSLALTQNGTLILQDGQSSKNGTMAYVLDCDVKSWHFDGGSECISRTANFTSTRIDFAYQIHKPQLQFGIFDDLYDDSDDQWKEEIQGVFTTTKYEPKITLYPVREIAKV